MRCGPSTSRRLEPRTRRVCGVRSGVCGAGGTEVARQVLGLLPGVRAVFRVAGEIDTGNLGRTVTDPVLHGDPRDVG